MYFAVKKPLKIGDKDYLPCVCYEVPRYLELTVNKLATEDRVIVSEDYMVFQNGKLVEKKSKVEKKPKKAAKEDSVVKENLITDKEEDF